MEREQREFFKQIFLDQIRDITSEKLLGQLSDVNNGDDVDRTLNEKENLISLKLQGRQNFLLKKMRAALKRIDDGSFGACEDCGAEISMKRLTARPTATVCISCKEENERSEKHVLYHKRSHTHGKTFSNANNVVPLNNDNSEGPGFMKLINA